MSEECRITAVVTGLKGKCHKGHKVGDRMEVSAHGSGGLCGFFYHDVYPAVTLLQYGGAFPWMKGDVLEMECPDRFNLLTIELHREKK